MKLTNELQPLLSAPTMSKAQQTREARLMRRMYRTEQRLTRRLEKQGPRRFLVEAIAIARRRGDEARNRIVMANVRLVAWWAKRFLYGPISLSFEELVSLGCVRMVGALRRFNPTKGAVSTFLGFHFRSVFARATGRTTNPKQVAQMRLVSMDSENASEIADRDRSREEQEKAAQTEDRMRIVQGCLPHLRERDRDVLERRYGLDGRGGRTMEQVGLELCLTRGRIQQLEARAVGQLKRHVERPLALWTDAGAPVVTDRRTAEFTIAPPRVVDLSGVAHLAGQREVDVERPCTFVRRKLRRMQRIAK